MANILTKDYLMALVIHGIIVLAGAGVYFTLYFLIQVPEFVQAFLIIAGVFYIIFGWKYSIRLSERIRMH